MSGRTALSPAQLAQLEDFLARLAPARERALLTLGLNTGLRIRELLGLRVGQVWDGQAVRAKFQLARRHQKNGRGARRQSVHSRCLPLNAAAAAALTAYLQGRQATAPLHRDEPLFRSREGTLSPRQALRRVRAIFAAAGLDPAESWGTHSLRKTFARCVYAQSGHDLTLVKAALGHAHLSTTDHYLAVSDDAVAQAIQQLGRPGIEAMPNRPARSRS